MNQYQHDILISLVCFFRSLLFVPPSTITTIFLSLSITGCGCIFIFPPFRLGLCLSFSFPCVMSWSCWNKIIDLLQMSVSPSAYFLHCYSNLVHLPIWYSSTNKLDGMMVGLCCYCLFACLYFKFKSSYNRGYSTTLIQFNTIQFRHNITQTLLFSMCLPSCFLQHST